MLGSYRVLAKLFYYNITNKIHVSSAPNPEYHESQRGLGVLVSAIKRLWVTMGSMGKLPMFES
jgi:hypothetical protein